MSQVTWNYGEVVNIDNAFRVDTADPKRKNPKAAGGIVSPAYRGEIEVLLSAGGPAFGSPGTKPAPIFQAPFMVSKSVDSFKSKMILGMQRPPKIQNNSVRMFFKIHN